MMRYAALLLSSLLAITSACAHGGACQPPDLAWIVDNTADIPARSDLVHVLQMFFESHCTCVRSRDLMERITYGAGRTGTSNRYLGEACLGPVEIVNQDLGKGPVVWLEVRPLDKRGKENGDGSFLVTAVYSGESWSVYPAEPVVETLY